MSTILEVSGLVKRFGGLLATDHCEPEPGSAARSMR